MMKLELTIQQWNYVISVLSQRPYNEVAEIIDDIKAQANKIVSAPIETVTPDSN